MTIVVTNGRSSPSQEGPQRTYLHHALTLSKNAGNANVGRKKKLPLVDHISWYLPSIAERLAITEQALRRHLFEQTGGMSPNLKVFPPPIGGHTADIFGDLEALPKKPLKPVAFV
ncbi:MAG: hypothetical protein ACR2RF_02685 [Geminicoccaceae bacterium]